MTFNPLAWFRASAAQSRLSQVIHGAAAGIQREADLVSANRLLNQSLSDLRALEALRVREQDENERELLDARMMADPSWRMPQPGMTMREATGISAQGAYGDIELALQNVDWRREINTSWLEFSRWGIQQIMLISRLYFVKNPMIQRGINVSAQYVFGRGVEITSDDQEANEVIKAFIARNKRVLGQVALQDLERRKYYDGNLFFALPTDASNSGEVEIRTIDAIEIQEIVCDPDDQDVPRYYRRQWVMSRFDEARGATENVSMTAWYPALGYDPPAKPETIGGYEVRWDTPIYHRKCGGVGKWKFGIPLVYAALDWARAQRRMLEAFATIRQSLSQISMIASTKGGQQAMQGMKSQLSTTVGPSASLWDQNPTAVDGSIFVSGPGTKLEAFNTQGAGGDPSDCREYKLMVAMVFGVPESFFADMNTSNLATATSLDRPTELNFMAKQEEWREDLAVLVNYALVKSLQAPSGRLRERRVWARKPLNVEVMEASKVGNAKGKMVYGAEVSDENRILVQVNFPTIIEADVPQQVRAVVDAMTLGRAGEVHGIDERAGIGELYKLIDVENGQELLEQQYPTDGPEAYTPIRKKEEPQPVKPTGKPAEGAPVREARSEEVKTLQDAARRLARAVLLLKAAESGTADSNS